MRARRSIGTANENDHRKGEDAHEMHAALTLPRRRRRPQRHLPTYCKRVLLAVASFIILIPVVVYPLQRYLFILCEIIKTSGSGDGSIGVNGNDPPHNDHTVRDGHGDLLLQYSHESISIHDTVQQKIGKHKTTTKGVRGFQQRRSLVNQFSGSPKTTQAHSVKLSHSKMPVAMKKEKNLKQLAQRALERRQARIQVIPTHPRLNEIVHTPLADFVPAPMLGRNVHNLTATSPQIPHHLIFTYKDNILETHMPPLLYQNVLATIAAYRRAWNEPHAPVWFLTDTDCELALGHVSAEMLNLFAFEANGSFKADMCRVAALYLVGGYYFDIDLRVVTPVQLDVDVAFSTVEMMHGNDQKNGYFFQAFLAAAPRNAVLHKTLQVMQDYYQYKLDNLIMGPRTMRKAFDSLAEKDIGKYVLFQELNLEASDHESLYPDLPRQHGVGPGLCNYIVHDPRERVVYFYSRIVGTSSCAEVDTESGTPNTQEEAGGQQEAIYRLLSNIVPNSCC
jgi:hypothetical protein